MNTATICDDLWNVNKWNEWKGAIPLYVNHKIYHTISTSYTELEPASKCMSDFWWLKSLCNVHWMIIFCRVEFHV
jgi:hypothetical protein